MSVFELFGRIAVDSSGAEKGLNDTVKHAKGAEGKLAATFKKIGGLVAAAFSVRAIVDFGKQCTEAYASIAAEESAFAQIMGDYADTAQAKLNAVSDATGVSATRMTGAMTSLTAKFKGLGYNVADATTLATDGLLIATDAAAFWDMSLDESMSHLNSFINGSYEGGEAIGLFANDTQMAAYAIEQGIVKDAKAWAKLDEATKQATRLDYAKKMMADSGATGQAAKEADAYANVMANLKESWRQFQGVVGKPILEKLVLPAMQKLNNFLPKLTEGVQNGIVFLEEGFGKIKEYFTDVFTEDGIKWDALPDAMTKMFRDMGSSAGKLLRSFGQKLKTGWTNTVWPAIQGVAAKIGIELPGWTEIETKVKTWWAEGGFAKSIADACNWTLNLFGAPATVTAEDVSGVLSTWWTSAKTFVQSACSWALKLFTHPEETAEQIKTHTKTWWDNVVSHVKSACTWSLNLFSAPDGKPENVASPLATWWATAKPYVQSACSWALDVFSSPPELTPEEVETILDEWWATTSGYVKSACDWVLNTFSAPAEETAQGVQERLKTWWTNTQKHVQDACQWTLNLFNNPTTDQKKIKEGITGWWDVVCSVVEGTCTWALGLFSAPQDTEDSSAVSVITTWWAGKKDAVQKACSWALSLFSAPQDTEDSSAVSVITTWWAGKKDAIQKACSWALGLFDMPKESAEDVKKAVKSWWTGLGENILNGIIKFPAEFDFPTLEDITNWWNGLVKKLTLNLPFGLGNLFGNDEPGEGGKDGKDSGVGENGQGDGGKSSGDPKGGKWTPAALGMYDPNWSFGGGKNGTATLPSMLATINSTLSTLPAQVEAAAASGVATGVGNITVTGHVTTGNVMLDGSALVGRLAPRINLALGGSGMLRTSMRNPNP